MPPRLSYTLTDPALPTPSHVLASPSGRQLALASPEGITLLELHTGERRLLSQHRWRRVRALVAFSPDDAHLAVEHPGGRQQSPISYSVLELSTGRRSHALEEPADDYWAARSGATTSAALNLDHLVIAKEKFTGRWGHVDADFYSDVLLSWTLQTGQLTSREAFEGTDDTFVEDQRVIITGISETGTLFCRRRLRTRGPWLWVERALPGLEQLGSWQEDALPGPVRDRRPPSPPVAASLRGGDIELNFSEAPLAERCRLMMSPTAC